MSHPNKPASDAILNDKNRNPAGPRIRREQRTIGAMLTIYCRDHHGDSPLCEDCRNLLDYAHGRLNICPFGEEKPACNHCQVHCYSTLMRERVKQVMRYAGPRMLTRHPVLALFHILDKLRKVPSLKKTR
jgi:hypothetical protein